MAIIAISVADSIEYVSDRDPCKVVTQVPIDPLDLKKGTKPETEIRDGATKFFLNPLDVFLMAHIYDNASSLMGKQGSDEVGIKTRMNQTNIDAVRYGLSGFENFQDKNGNSVKFTTVDHNMNGRDYKVASDDVLKALGIRMVQELGSEIKEISEVSAAEEKNSV